MGFSRGLVVAVVMVVTVIAIGLIAGKSNTPATGAPTLLSFGSRVKLPPSHSKLNYTNGWVATTSANGVGVYAGSQANDHNNGMLLIARTQSGKRKFHAVVLHSSGVVTLLKPATPHTEAAALGESIRFVTASGRVGTLNLSGDKVSLSSG
jgi:hypothetical protein